MYNYEQKQALLDDYSRRTHQNLTDVINNESGCICPQCEQVQLINADNNNQHCPNCGFLRIW